MNLTSLCLHRFLLLAEPLPKSLSLYFLNPSQPTTISRDEEDNPDETTTDRGFRKKKKNKKHGD